MDSDGGVAIDGQPDPLDAVAGTAEMMPDYSRFKGVFKPHRTDDLRPELFRFIGMELVFSYAWTMDADDPYPGDIAYSCHAADWPGYWVPGRDIQRV